MNGSESQEMLGGREYPGLLTISSLEYNKAHKKILGLFKCEMETK